MRAFGGLLLFLAAALMGILLIDTDENASWSPYATNVEVGELEFWWTQYESRADCINQIGNNVHTTPNSKWYSEPVGCGYFGNNYVRVILFNYLFMGSSLGCIIHFTDKISTVRYAPVLNIEPFLKRGDGWYCVSPLDILL